ncbi:MAG: molybdopterin molybdenumtransferase MoeA [Gallionellales bacterium 35-53-114]|jgi:molybdopterin molybdotransferase|nr:MAG: molybdopterin molybdenumtransferase MoeA [Gallionellales bacterium 35-53-114]OYZ63966.1 MAG: molybdopterin molybdenumtransferase MoeA [Gallionellales bacterium 24-53-125]OZB09206.1 MAG: molybdopterin molybdenumtransferase MoeA [Gallionellales bacterium 39-52-133]HQS59198.1 molybdopterin molybdotransferase MoeA [Gallionellaceae bacterium]HQS75934.1 molybdopterin molybdotransferase MoeA [Gallionellaceae bacterium]
MESQHLTLSTLASMEDYDPNSMPVEQARQLIKQFLSPVTETETIKVQDAYHRTLAADILSPINVPPHDYSSMDGYAVRAADLGSPGNKLKKIGSSFAGHGFEGTVAAGECVRIMTGATIPSGCDSVVMQEQVSAEGDSITFNAACKRGQNIRLVGEDIQQGAVVLAQGQRINPAEMGLLASLGFAEITVFRKLKIAIFSTGDELVQPGNALSGGQIYDSNRFTLVGLLTELGAEILDMGNIRDDKNAVRAALQKASGLADVIITSGGVSVGDADYIKELLDELGEVVFWKLAMKPGRPLAYGKVGHCHFFGLPGNPVAVMVTFLQFVRNALWELMGQHPKPAFSFQAICTTPIKKAQGRTEFQRGILTQSDDGLWTVQTTGEQGSGILSSMSRANCFIVLPMEQGNVEKGSVVQIQLF